ncbi:phosphonate C-P lyase system protein PhnH [Loktanella sp. S4079]|uniref:phosphonate C-P lyase system protein PhnH n=1 Tax=Loktanella sp. S4079 TaxID=579483 RepID=UPI0005FA1B34|nr:phosphonate C-P lyase system protein PhnH [Loktanella sp. S4079]KJZ18847.1 carbon-phosphorus lyase [Loktanella sp. S4079]
MQVSVLEGGFADAPVQSARAFREIMTAMAQPGRINTVDGAHAPGISVASSVALLTLCDPDTPLYLAPSLDTADLRNWIAFHTAAPLVTPDKASFALGAWSELLGQDFPIGIPEYPDRSATLIVEMPALSATGATLRGPGIKDMARLSLPDADAMRDNTRLFPLGMDFILTCGSQLAAMPRTTRID